MQLSAELFPLRTPIIRRAERISLETYRDVYEGNRHRVYSLAFYMTDSEIAAEDMLTNTFCRAFSQSRQPDSEAIDRALVDEIKELMPVGNLTLSCSAVAREGQVGRRTHRVDLERAIVALPPTERMIFLMADVESYDHPRIARTLGIAEAESRRGLFQARLKLRELLVEAAS